MKKTVKLLVILCTVYSVSAKNPIATGVLDTTVVSNENIVYKVVEDKENFHISISTKDNDIIMSMLRMGVTVFFDVKGKKKEDVYIKYPLKPIRLGSKRDEEDVPSKGFKTLEEEKRSKQYIAKLIEKDLPQEAEYHHFDSQEEFHILLNSLNASISYTYNEENGLLEYRLKIPKNRISSSSKEDFSKLVIGVKTNKKEQTRPKADNRSKSNTRGGRPSSGGRGDGGGRGKRSNGANLDNQNMQDALKTIDFWFTVSL